MNKKEFIDSLLYSQPFTENDLEMAMEFGRQAALEEVRLAMIGMVVNGTCQSVLTEVKFKEILNNEKTNQSE